MLLRNSHVFVVDSNRVEHARYEIDSCRVFDGRIRDQIRLPLIDDESIADVELREE